MKKAFIVGVISMVVGTSFVMPTTTFAKTENVILENKSKAQFEIKNSKDIEILEIEWKKFVDENPNKTEEEQEKHLIEFVNKGGLNEKKVVFFIGYKDFYKLNKEEKRLALLHPIQAIKVRKAVNIAYEKTQLLYGKGDNIGYQDNADAFRHCFWNALMKQSIGVFAAEKWATAHEIDQSGIDKEMDLHNNQVGRTIYIDNQPIDNIVSTCKDNVKKGKCRRIINNKLVPTNNDGIII